MNVLIIIAIGLFSGFASGVIIGLITGAIFGISTGYPGDNSLLLAFVGGIIGMFQGVIIVTTTHLVTRGSTSRAMWALVAGVGAMFGVAATGTFTELNPMGSLAIITICVAISWLIGHEMKLFTNKSEQSIIRANGVHGMYLLAVMVNALIVYGLVYWISLLVE